mmetsp:Transcript_26836/g.72481  ORF Transcript_26836/g.72481 Transcript_26836/m.72481 type:complete len:189 (+) Transcript_26836:398-964(+)
MFLAPLCYPKERQERMRSLRLTGSYTQGSARHTDCPWLPLLICTAQYSLQPRQPEQSKQQQMQQELQELVGQPDAGASRLVAACDSLQRKKDAGKQGGGRGHTEAAAPLSKSNSSGSSSLPCLLTHLHQQEEGVAVEVATWSLEACPSYNAMWSHYYQTHKREPNNTELAPWVASLPHYVKRRARGLL